MRFDNKSSIFKKVRCIWINQQNFRSYISDCMLYAALCQPAKTRPRFQDISCDFRLLFILRLYLSLFNLSGSKFFCQCLISFKQAADQTPEDFYLNLIVQRKTLAQNIIQRIKRCKRVLQYILELTATGLFTNRFTTSRAFLIIALHHFDPR